MSITCSWRRPAKERPPLCRRVAASGTRKTLKPKSSKRWVSRARAVVFPAQGPPVSTTRYTRLAGEADPGTEVRNSLVRCLKAAGAAPRDPASDAGADTHPAEAIMPRCPTVCFRAFDALASIQGEAAAPGRLPAFKSVVGRLSLCQRVFEAGPVAHAARRLAAAGARRDGHGGGDPLLRGLRRHSRGRGRAGGAPLRRAGRRAPRPVSAVGSPRRASAPPVDAAPWDGAGGWPRRCTLQHAALVPVRSAAAGIAWRWCRRSRQGAALKPLPFAGCDRGLPRSTHG